MKNIKKILCLLLALIMVLSMGCGKKETPEADAGESAQADTSKEEAPKEEAPKEEAKDEAGEMANLVLSGMTGDSNEYQKKLFELFESRYPDVEIELVASEIATREQVLKTAISAGDPPAVGFYWGTRLGSFYNNDMCLDLTEYFTKEELDLFDPSMMETCMGPNGEVFGIPFSTVYHTAFYNKDMMDEYGFEIPETWDEMTAIFARVKEDGIFGFSTNSASMQDCLYGMTYAELEKTVGPGTAYGVANGDVSVAPGSPAGEVIRKCIEQVQAWYDAGYWYPGEAGINTTQDDGNAGFAQGKVIFNFNFSGAFAVLQGLSDFEIGTFMKPTSEKGMTSYENIEPDVYFIPSNASPEQINSGIAFLRLGLEKEVQQTIVDSNMIPSIMSIEYENMSPILQVIISKFDTGGLKAGLNPTRTSSEMQTFVKTVIFAGPLGGTMTIDEALDEMESIRLAATK